MSAFAPSDWPVLVTGAGGFVGGHIARTLARDGHPVVATARKPPRIEPDDPALDWRYGDLRDVAFRRSVVKGVRGVIHAAGWVSLGADRTGASQSLNIDLTRHLLADSSEAGAERFVFTSTLHTLAAGTAEAPADEDAAWNLSTVDAPYSRTKREAERIALHGTDRTAGLALCPGMTIGARDDKPTSTRVLLMMARSFIAYLPGGGIPVVDASVVARAHARALSAGDPGARYAVVGPYLSYRDMARLVAQVAGRPRLVVPIPDAFERPLVRLAGWLGGGEISSASVAGGFLHLHVRGDRADRAFGLVHPPPVVSIFEALEDARRAGRVPGLRLRAPEESATSG